MGEESGPLWGRVARKGGLAEDEDADEGVEGEYGEVESGGEDVVDFFGTGSSEAVGAGEVVSAVDCVKEGNTRLEGRNVSDF